MRRFRLLGFNAIRLPFSMQSLFLTAPRNFNSTCRVTSDGELQAATTPPNIAVPRTRLSSLLTLCYDYILSYDTCLPAVILVAMG